MERARIISCLALAIMLIAAPSRSQDGGGPLPTGIRIGGGFEEVRAHLAGYATSLLDAKKPGQLTDGLLDTGLLATMNHSNVVDHPFLKEGAGGTQQFLLATRPGEILVVGFVQGTARAVLQRRSATVAAGTDPFDPGRLSPIRWQLANIAQACAAGVSKKDRYANRFEFFGRCYGGNAFVRYRPENSEIVLLVMAAGPASTPQAAPAVLSSPPKEGDILRQKKFGDETAPGAVEIKTVTPPAATPAAAPAAPAAAPATPAASPETQADKEKRELRRRSR